MDKIIHRKLKEIEKNYNITVLYACESGSRAWGFESPDSDYDIRFIYVNKLDFYLSIESKKDTIEFSDGLLDFAGWDLKKALYLLRKSNPSIIEWINSPIIYKKDKEFFSKIKDLSNISFNPKTMMYHYLHMAKTNYRTYLKTDYVKIKKYFYVIRPILALIWIEKNNSVPPVRFKELLESVQLSNNVKKEIENLIEIKHKKKELDLHPKINILNSFIEENISYYEKFLKNIDIQKKLLEEKEYDLLLKQMIFKYDKDACYTVKQIKK